MKRLISLFIFCFFGVAVSYAQSAPLLRGVSMQLSASRWVQTTSALVTVTINASANKEKVTAQRIAFVKALSALTPKSTWRVVTLSQEKSASGLLQTQYIVNARLTSSQIATVRKGVVELSKAGSHYAVTGVSYRPSEVELAKARHALRVELYQKIKQEVATLNATFKGQHYSVKQVSFSLNNIRPFPRMQSELVMNKSFKRNDAARVVSQLQMDANIVLATHFSG